MIPAPPCVGRRLTGTSAAHSILLRVLDFIHNRFDGKALSVMLRLGPLILRNILRNRRRSLLTLASTAISLFSRDLAPATPDSGS